MKTIKGEPFGMPDFEIQGIKSTDFTADHPNPDHVEGVYYDPTTRKVSLSKDMSNPAGVGDTIFRWANGELHLNNCSGTGMGLTVGELRRNLESYSDDAEVFIECGLDHRRYIKTAKDWVPCDCKEMEGKEPCKHKEWYVIAFGLVRIPGKNKVFITGNF